MGVDEDGYREVLDFFIGVNESAYVWEDSLRQVKDRGVDEVFPFVMDGLTDLDDAVHRGYSKADLKIIYESPNLAQCKAALDNFSTKWSKCYKRLVESWLNDEDLFTYYKYPVSMRKSISIQRTGSSVLTKKRDISLKQRTPCQQRMHAASLFIIK